MTQTKMTMTMTSEEDADPPECNECGRSLSSVEAEGRQCPGCGGLVCADCAAHPHVDTEHDVEDHWSSIYMGQRPGRS